MNFLYNIFMAKAIIFDLWPEFLNLECLEINFSKILSFEYIIIAKYINLRKSQFYCYSKMNFNIILFK